MINENLLEILKKVKNSEISIEDGTQELKNIKNNHSEVLFYQNYSILANQIVQKDIKNEYIIVLADDVEHINVIKSLNLDNTSNGNQLLWISRGNSFKQNFSSIEMDLNNEAHFEQLSNYVYSSNDNRKIRIIYMIGEHKSQTGNDWEYQVNSTGITALLFAKTFAYRFNKSGVRFQIFSTERASEITVFQEAVVALGRSIEKEVPAFITQVVIINPQEVSSLGAVISKELHSEIDTRFTYYKSDKRMTYNISEMAFDAPKNYHEFPEGVYVILGGLGAIGKAVTAEIAKLSNTKIILVGRRKISDEIETYIEALRHGTNEITYISADISNHIDIKRLFHEVGSKFEKIDYVFHCAGILEDCRLPNKSVESFKRVISSKINGALAIIDMKRTYNFKKVLFFSSTSGVFGNEGQLDYAYANMLINSLCEKQSDPNIISISWPFWDTEGMKMPKEYKEKIFSAYGFRPMPTRVGIDIVKHTLADNSKSLIVLYGDRQKLENFSRNTNIDKYIEAKDSSANTVTKEIMSANDNNDGLLDNVIMWITEIISKVTGIDTDSLTPKKSIQNLGIDSVMTTEINIEFEKVFDNISKTLLFEYRCIKEIAEHFIQNYYDACKNKFIIEKSPEEIVEAVHIEEIEVTVKDEIHEGDSGAFEIAVIGIAGKYPKAESLDVFWENLKAGMDCIDVIPKSRWDYMNYCDENADEWWKSSEKWGGFIEGVDEFDSLVFNIAPAEAKAMDPHQRVYAQTVWHALEDAGYNKKRLEKYKVGVYTGAMWSNYQLYGIEDAYNGKMEGYDSSLASISNRISYIFNLHGPSITLDTMCSSSLTALQLAYQSIQNHDIDMAVVGGVNLTLHPYKYIQLKKGNFLSKDGRCRSFGEGGSGYVPGEGAGSFIVKRLDRALADKDKIYGIIKGVSINHGGKAQGYFVPNPIEQANVINAALENAGIDKKSISYIEAHGTGTSLGDPIEIAGLRKVFEKDNNQKQSISIGSVKSNIGHLEAAAGMASLTKVLLQMKYKMLVPSIHAEKLNPNVDMKTTPFKVQTQLEPWSGDDNNILRAGISSFGAGGANAHVILEGYDNSYKNIIETKAKKIFVLSVKNEKALLRYIDLYRNFLLETPQVAGEYEFDTRFAYTTQIGRNHMNVRVAIVFENTKQLIQCLEDITLGNEKSLNVFINNVSNDKLDVKSLDIETLKYDLSANAIEIAQAWVDGYEVEWEKFYSEKMAIVNLPLYPFEKIKHWAPLGESRIYKMKNEAESICIDLYKKQWSKSEASSSTTEIYNANIVFLIKKEQSFLKSAAIKAMNSDSAEFIEVDDASTVCEASLESKFIFNHKNKTVVIDLSDLQTGSEEIFKIPHSKFNLYKHLIKQTRQAGLDILHCTQSVNEGITQNGVLTAGLMKSLGAEYPWIQSKTIDFTMDYTTDSIFNSLKNEFTFDGNSEVFYKAGIRNTTGYQQLEFNWKSDNAFKVEKDKCYIITGGTRGIGAKIASRLAELGAKKLVLLGRSDMNTPEKKELLKDLKAHGAEVLVYSQGLHNKTALEDFFKQVYQQFGEVHIMFHCAGRYSTENAAFIHKEEREIEDVLEPKVSGLLNMLEATKVLQVEKTVLFSSISSICPWLSKGVSDYTMANNYLNGMPEYGKNITDSQVLSVVWQSWSDVGFMVSEPKIGKENGLIPINCKEGIDILFNILQKEVSGVVVPVKHNEVFEIEKLSVLSKNKPESDFTQQTVDNKRLSSEVNEITEIITRVISDVLLININEISLDEAFENYGMDSIFLGEVIKKLEEKLHTVIDPVLFFECNTIRKISTALTGIVNISLPKKESIEIKPCGVNENPRFAVIGADCRFPDADNCIEYWNNLMEEKCSVREIPKERFDMEPFYSPTPEVNKSIGKWAAMVKDIEYFDPKAFEIPEAEAATMDPLIRIQLETSVNALRNAGYDKADVKGKNIGVFIGSRVGDFHSLMPKEQKAKITGLGQNFIAAYTSHYLDLKGPSMVIDTACSSSMVALSEACKNIHFGECEQAIVGGVDLILCENTLVLLSDALSPTGVCSAFDEKANGFVPGEGCGTIVIKKLEQAIADGDNILAVVESVAINNDGHTMGITTPNYNMQMDVIKRAIERTDIAPEYISYIEAHGTGTFIGDPIELKALTSVFREYTDKKNYCGIGSVKTNIGHCLSAAGMASIIKVVLCLQNKMLPKTLNCDKPNSRFNFEQSPFFPCTKNKEWEGINGRRIAGISSFGFGGTNAHVILSEYTGHHEVIRQPLPPLALNKKYYWFDKKEPTSTAIFNTNSEANMFGLKKMF